MASYKINTLFTVTYDNLKNAISNIKTQFKSVEQSAENAKNKVSNAFKNANKDIEKTNKAIKESSDLIDSGLKASAIGVAAITVPTILAGKSALTMAGQYESATQTLEYTLGDAKSIVDDFIEHNAQSLGMGEQDAYKFANIYSNLLTTITDDQTTNAEYTNKLMQASAVIMSKTGRTFTDVADRIRSGLLGNTEAIEDLGVNVNVALLETTDAFNKIADGRSWEQLTFQEQQQVRLLGILEQTTKKYGEEVGQNLALKLAQTSANFNNVKTEASQFLSVGLQPLLSGINSVLTGIMTFVKYLNSLDDGTKKAITTFIVIIAIIPMVALAFLTLIKAINSYVIFTKTASLTTQFLTKSVMGLIGSIILLAAGLLMIAYAFGAFDSSSKNVNKASKNTATATKALDGLSTSQNNNAKSAKEASKANKELADNLQGFDEINKLNIDNNVGTGGNIDSGIGPTIDLSGIDTGAFDDIGNQFENLNSQVESFKNNLEKLKPLIGIVGAILAGLGIKTLIKDIGKLLSKLGLLKGDLSAISSIGTIALGITIGITLGKWYADNIENLTPEIVDIFRRKYGMEYENGSFIKKFSINLQMVLASMGTKLIDLLPGISEEDAISYLTNVGSIIVNAAKLVNIFDIDTFKDSWRGVWDGLKNMTKDTLVGEFFQACYDFVTNTIKLINIFNPEEFKKSWASVWEQIKTWFKDTGVGMFFDNVYSLITGQKWDEVWEIIKTSGQNMWSGFNSWWSSTGIPNWWNNNVAPWFTKEKWSNLKKKKKNGIINKFNEFKSNFQPIKDWWNNNIAPWFTWDKWKQLGQDAVNGIKNAFENMNIKIKMPHFTWTSTPATGWIADILSALSLPTSLPKLNVEWYANGGVFENKSIIGVGEYAGARNNPEIVTPQSMMYDTVIKANKDSSIQNSNLRTGSDNIKKKIEVEVDLTSGGVKLGKQIVDLVLDANDFYDLGLI